MSSVPIGARLRLSCHPLLEPAQREDCATVLALMARTKTEGTRLSTTAGCVVALRHPAAALLYAPGVRRPNISTDAKARETFCCKTAGLADTFNKLRRYRPPLLATHRYSFR